MEELFVYAPEAYENTEKIASMIDLELDVGGYKIPKFPLSEEEKKDYLSYKEGIKNEKGVQNLSEEEWFLRSLCIE